MKDFIFIGRIAGLMAAVISAFTVTLLHERIRRYREERINRRL